MGLFIVEFDLTKSSRLTVEEGDVILDKGYSTVTVRNVEAETHDDAESKARLKANALLDELSRQYDINLELGNGCTMMLQDSPTTRHIKKYKVKVFTRGGHRRKYPHTLKEVVIKPSDSKAYYRKASISQDIFDKYRNLYLAIENVASKIATAKSKRFGYGQELDLLRFALQECFSSDAELLEEYGHISGFNDTGDIFFDVATFLYKKNRIQLSHSKASESKKIPFNAADEWEVQVSLRLTEFVAKSFLTYEDTYLLC
jgi:hypothetical protein